MNNARDRLHALVLGGALLAACSGARPAARASSPAPSSGRESAAASESPRAVTPSTSSAPDESPAPRRPDHLEGTPIRFEGGDGSSVERAVLIRGAQGETDGTASEYSYLGLVYGARGEAWQMVEQALLGENGRHYDMLEIVVRGGVHKRVYFDITEYFGHF